MIELTIRRAAYEAIVAHARLMAPNECVGALLGNDERIVAAFPMESIDPSPTTFEADPLSMMKAQYEADSLGCDVVGYFHSHPTSPAKPSATDRARQVWPDLPPFYHIIVSLMRADEPAVRAFHTRDRLWSPLGLRIED
jgi:proteasome lid subunit RPN8/RPN11